MKKNLVSLILALALCMGLTVPALAFDTAVTGQTNPVSLANTGGCYVVDEDGVLWEWNLNEFVDRGQPERVAENVASVYYGGLAILKKDGSLWGRYSLTGLGTDDEERYNEYVKLMDGVSSVSLYEDVAAILKTDGSLWMCGSNLTMQIGNGGAGDRHLHFTNWYGKIFDYNVQTTPIKIMDNVTCVSVGYNHTAAVTADGSLWMWGQNDKGQLGFSGGNTTVKESYSDLEFYYDAQSVPRKVMDGVVAVSAGWENTAAVKADGSLWTWGNNVYGQLGNGTKENSFTPVKVLEDVASVSLSSGYTMAIKTDGSLWGWGDNSSGQLGNGGKANAIPDGYASDLPNFIQTVPVKVATDVAAVGARIFSECTAIIKNDGSVWTAGLMTGREGTEDDEDLEMPEFVNAWKSSTFVKATGNVKAALPGAFTVSVPAKPAFTDVADSAYYAASVAWAVEKGITAGTTETTFSPNNTCTTAQILTFLWRAKGQPEPTIANPFSDVAESAYYYKAALWAYENGMVSGTTFGGGTPCTRSATVTYLWKLAGSPDAAPSTFTDVASGAEYAPAVAWAVEKGVTGGTTATTFSPDNTCTRGQIVTFLHRDMA